MIKKSFCIGLILISTHLSLAGQEDQNLKANWNRNFGKLFGEKAYLDFTNFYPDEPPAVGEHLLVDSDQDNRPDIEIRTVAISGRAYQPITLVILDRDGDMTVAGDTDSDLWIADWDNDKIIDRVISYQDDNGDNILDAMFIYYSGFAYASPGGIYGVDLDQDNYFFSTTDFEYYQPIDQWKSDYSGNAYFTMLYYDKQRDKLKPTNESPFCFYDIDGDGLSNLAVRITSKEFPWRESTYSTFRYSLDVDNDATAANPYDYDFSISGIGNIDYQLYAKSEFSINNKLTLPAISWELCDQAILTERWDRIMLTWDEDDSNYSDVIALEDSSEKKLERWEGVINIGNDVFPQIGGPPSKNLNTRTETLIEEKKGFNLYYSEIDKKIHLYGAEPSRYFIDADGDLTEDLTIEMRDTTGDGYYDQWSYRFSDHTMTVENKLATNTPLKIARDDYSNLVEFYRQSLLNSKQLLCAIGQRIGIDQQNHQIKHHCTNNSDEIQGLEKFMFHYFYKIVFFLNDTKDRQYILRKILEGDFQGALAILDS